MKLRYCWNLDNLAARLLLLVGTRSQGAGEGQRSGLAFPSHLCSLPGLPSKGPRCSEGLKGQGVARSGFFSALALSMCVTSNKSLYSCEPFFPLVN